MYSNTCVISQFYYSTGYWDGKLSLQACEINLSVHVHVQWIWHWTCRSHVTYKLIIRGTLKLTQWKCLPSKHHILPDTVMYSVHLLVPCEKTFFGSLNLQTTASPFWIGQKWNTFSVCNKEELEWVIIYYKLLYGTVSPCIIGCC